MNTKSIGAEGENLAKELLTSKGYAIVEQNAIVGSVEVDLICMHANRVIFVEVKSRKADHLDPDYSIDSTKLRRLARAADSYVRRKNLPHEAQIDALLIDRHPDGSVKLTHLPDVAFPPMRRR